MSATTTGERHWFHSTNEGRTWRRIHPSPRSLLHALALDPGAVYDDGFGNRYRCEVDEAEVGS